MIRLDRENLPIDLLGSLQPTTLMVLDRNRQCFGNRCHQTYYTVIYASSGWPARGHGDGSPGRAGTAAVLGIGAGMRSRPARSTNEAR